MQLPGYDTPRDIGDSIEAFFQQPFGGHGAAITGVADEKQRPQSRQRLDNLIIHKILSGK